MQKVIPWRFFRFSVAGEMETLPLFIRDHAEGGLLSWGNQVEAAKHFGVTYAQVEEVALERGILPARYQRNRKTLSAGDQLTLFRSCVAVVGCGGLGGYVIEELARLGVGQLVVIDPDSFEEHNLNRQLLSSLDNLGTAKVEAASKRVKEINPATTVVPHQIAFSSANGLALLAGCHLAVDALDNIHARFELAGVCSLLGIPMVHGAIAGWYGHVTTLLPGDSALSNLYPCYKQGKGIEQLHGNPAFTPALVASMQVAETCKMLLGNGNSLRGRTLMIDLLSMEFREL